MKITELTPIQIERLRSEISSLLETFGLRVDDPSIRALAVQAGASTDEATGIIRFPKALQDSLLSSIPKQYAVANLLGETKIIGGAEQYIASIVMDPFMLGPSGPPERPSLAHLKKNLALIQSMPDVAQVSLMDFPVTDDASSHSNLLALETFLCNHSKHYSLYVTSMESMERWLEIGKILSAGKPLENSSLFTVAVASLSPMVVNQLNCDLLRTACRYRFPIVPTVCPMAGSTAPYSQIGLLLQGLAECIGIALLSQLLNPGNPFLLAVGPSVADLANVHDLYYTFDKHLWRIVIAEMAHSYQLPFMLECGGSMPSHHDMQAGAESMLSMLFSVGCGASILSGLGSCYNANGLSAEMICIQYAWKEASQFLSQGLSFAHLDASVESLREEGHGGHFLMNDLTLELMHSSEFFSLPVLDYSGKASAEPLLYQRAAAEAEKIAAAHVSPVPASIQQALHAFFQTLRAQGGSL